MIAHSPGHGCLHCGCTASQMPSELTEPPVYPAQASVTKKKVQNCSTALKSVPKR
jgi:hypothetical protein